MNYFIKTRIFCFSVDVTDDEQLDFLSRPSVLSLSLNNRSTIFPNNTAVIITFPHDKDVNSFQIGIFVKINVIFISQLGQDAARYCVFWNYSLQAWSGEGCSVDWANSSLVQTVCRCNHLTNFGLLFDINGVLGDWDAVQMEILSILSVVLMSLSILASTLTFIILQFSRFLQHLMAYIYLFFS